MRRFSLYTLVPGALVPMLLASAPRVDAQERTVTLADAIRLSERLQPSVVQARADIETASARKRNAWGSYLPTLSASSSASEFFSEGAARVDPVTGQILSGNSTSRSLNTSLSASLDLFTGFRRGAEMSAARAGERAADAGLVDARFQQALATTNQFFDALAARQLVGVREASVRRAEEQLKVSINKLHAGTATRSDSLRSLVTLGSARLDLINAETALAAAEAGLARLVGETGRVRATDDHRLGRGAGGRRGQLAPDPERRGRRQRRPGQREGLQGRLLAQPRAVSEYGMERGQGQRL
jgi:outer membrane protein